MPGQYELDAGIAQAIHHVEVLLAGHAEDAVHALVLQGGDKQVRTFGHCPVPLCADAADNHLREVLRGCHAAEVACANPIPVQHRVDGPSQAPGKVDAPGMIQHEAGGEQQRGWIGDTLARDIGRGAMHGLEDRKRCSVALTGVA